MNFITSSLKKILLYWKEIVVKVKASSNKFQPTFAKESSNSALPSEILGTNDEFSSSKTYDHADSNPSLCTLYTATYNGTTCIQQQFCSGKTCSCCSFPSLLDIIKSILRVFINILCYPFIPCAVAFLPASFQFAGYSNTNSLYPCYGKTCCFCIKTQETAVFRLCCSPICFLVWISLALAVVCLAIWNYTQDSLIIEALLYFENLNEVSSAFLFVALFTLVSFPMIWGYVILNLAAGYLYGFWVGLCVVIFSVTCGLATVHVICRRYFASCVMNLLKKRSNFDQIEAILQVVDGKSGLKIIALTRLTPIPFGFQNGLFAVSKVSLRYYLLASDVGLLPTQILNCYIASKFRSMDEIVGEDSQKGYLLFFIQIAIGVALMMFVLQRARKELATALQNNEKSLITSLSQEACAEETVILLEEDEGVRLTQPSSSVIDLRELSTPHNAVSVLGDRQ